jgi:AraC-like DNA-binding protein
MEQIIIKAYKFIDEHLCDEFTLDEIARFVGYSSYHFARKFKEVTGKTIMEYVREKRICAAANEIKAGANICNTAMKYGFDTHAGFTKAFSNFYGCTPVQCAQHAQKSYVKGMVIMEESKIVIRPICKDDVQDLWENVYSAMTPRQITEEKILPAIEKLSRREGIELVAQVDGRVIMSLPMIKPFWIPLGVLFDNNYVLTYGLEDEIMEKLLEEMKNQCRMLNISTLISPQTEGSENAKAFLHFGFTEVWKSGGWAYLAMSI